MIHEKYKIPMSKPAIENNINLKYVWDVYMYIKLYIGGVCRGDMRNSVRDKIMYMYGHPLLTLTLRAVPFGQTKLMAPSDYLEIIRQ